MKRRPELDGLRGVACLAVVAAHFCPGPFVGAGAVGVAVFFVLSGYLITTLLIDEHARAGAGAVALRSFYERRARRLLPALVVICLVVAVVSVFGADPLGLAGTLLYVNNLAELSGVNTHPMQHAWSLAVEEHFYVLWPAAFVVARGRALHVALVAFGLSSLWRVWLLVGDADIRRIYIGTDTRISSMALGCIGAYLVRSGWRLPRWVIPAGGSLLTASCLLDVGALMWLSPAADAVALAVIVALVTNHSPALAHPTLVWVGTVSYGLYLWHLPLAGLTGTDLTGTLVGVPLSIAAAGVSYYLIELPMRSPVVLRPHMQGVVGVSEQGLVRC